MPLKLEFSADNCYSINMKARFFIIFFIFIVFTLASCSGEAAEGIKFSNPGLTISPGLTAEIVLSPFFADEKISGDHSSLPKGFSDPPAVTAESSSIRILSVKPDPSRQNSAYRIIIKASDEVSSGEPGLVTALWGGFQTESLIKIKKQPDLYITAGGIITDPAAFDAMINKNRRLPADYIPPDLVRINVPTILAFEEVNHLRKPAAEALSAMFDAAEEEKGYSLYARSGYRSYITQVSLFDSNVRVHGREYADKFSAQPGTSEHQSGLAMDITAKVMDFQLEQTFGETAEGLWTAENAHRFGFIIRYPSGKEEITGYAYEPWHLRYVGPLLAEEIYRGGLTLEEYFLNY